MPSIGLVASFAALAIGAPLAAQSNHFRTGDVQSSTATRQNQRRRATGNIPPGQMPPAGMCRIWIDGVPPGQQPAPTDCQTAVANRPTNARVIWGDQTALTGNGRVTSPNGRDLQAGQNGSVRGNRGRRGNDVENDNDNDDQNNGNSNSIRSSQWPVTNGGAVNSSRDESFKSKKTKRHGDD